MEKREIGLPATVSIYSPIEFLGLEKFTNAFLDIGLEHVKGGVGKQLLVGHLVKLVQNHGGATAIRMLPRFKPEYLEEIKTKCNRKGIDLDDLVKNPLVLDFNRIETLSDSISIHKPDDLLDRASNICCSSNYSMFHFLEFNRKIVWSHVNELRLSILHNGILSYPVMIYTNCVDGEWKYWIVDGQHRFVAFKQLGLPIYFTLYRKSSTEPISLYDLVKLIAGLNNTSKRWNIHQYLKAWKSIKVEEYEIISEVHKETKIPINILLQAYSGKNRRKATMLFMDGEYKMTDRENGERYVEYLKAIRPYISSGTAIQSSLLDLFRQTPDYDNEKMKSKLIEIRNSWVFPESHDEILSDLKKLYQEAA
jgi:hypothetical protein